MKNYYYRTGSSHFKCFFLSLMLLGIGIPVGIALPNPAISSDAYIAPIKGTIVSSADNLGVIGANILVKGTNSGTISDVDGSFEINANPDDVLVISYLGFVTQEITVGSQTNLSIVLVEDNTTLDEVVIVGYGTRKKSHNTGAIASVGGADIAAIQATRVDDALAGKLAGVLIQNQDGEPGADPKIQVRAASSISGNSTPLIVVDGYPISGSLATVNPSDIESLEVLKDAASAAIYGSRGANGVILVTTKSGKSGKVNISYDGYVSTSSRYVGDLDQIKTSGEWADILDAGIADGSYDVSEVDPALVNYRINAFRNSPDVVASEDWLFQSGSSHNHNFNMTGGSDDAKYFASVGYQNTTGVVIRQGFERYNARLKVDANLSNKFKAGINANGFVGDREIVGHDMRDLLRAYSVHPIYHTEASIAFVQDLDQQAQSLGMAAFDAGYRGGDAPFNNSIYTLEPGMTAQDWHYGRSGNGIGGSGDAGPATKLDNTNSTSKTYFGNVSTYLQYSILEGLDIKTVLGGDLADTRNLFSRTLEFDSRARTNQTRYQTRNTKRSSVLSETTLNYSKVIGDHDLSAVAGMEFQNFYIGEIYLNASNNIPFGQPLNYALLDPADIAVSERDETVARKSLFGRINYAYANKYLASVSIRRDGDSRFGANNRYEIFPAVSFGWNAHNESFFTPGFLSDLKLRLSYGSLGTTAFLGSYSSLSLLNPSATVLGTGFLIPANIGNPDLTWQTNTEANFGVNLGFNENRFRVGIDYYTSEIKDILINQSVSEVLGTTSIVLNSGDVKSSGLEIELGATVIQSADFTWNVNANLSTVNTEITDLGNLDELPRALYGQSGRAPVFRNYVGGEIGEMWGLETAGQVETTWIEDPTRSVGINSSAYYIVDQNNDGVINRTRTVAEGGDLVKIGQNTPDFYWGLNSQMSINDFDVSLQFQGAQGGDVWNVDPIYWQSQFGPRVRDSFDAEGDGIADHNGLHYEQPRNALDSQIQDASYIALRNLTLGYTINPSLGSVGSVRVYAAATNLLYLMGSNYTSLNPEGVEITNGGYLGPTTYGVQVGASPVVRSFTFGVNVNF